MKLAVYILTLAFSFSSFADTVASLDDMVGIYKVTINEQIQNYKVENTLAISAEKNEEGHNIIGLNEYLILDGQVVGKLECAGSAKMTPGLEVISTVFCKRDSGDEIPYTQKTNLSNVEDLTAKNFEAPVYSSLYGVEKMATFVKLTEEEIGKMNKLDQE